MSGYERFLEIVGGEQNLPPLKTAGPQPDLQQEEVTTDEKVNKRASWGPLTNEQIDEMNKKLEEEHYARWGKDREEWATNGGGDVNGELRFQPQFTPTVHYHPPTDADLKFDPRKGEPAPRGFCFSPFGAIKQYCYKYVPGGLRQPLATAFFDANKIYMRPWDQYFIWSRHFNAAKPVLVVPEHQFQQLLDEINLAFPGAKLSITDELRAEGLAIDFDGLPDSLRPRWLGQSTSREQLEYWTDHLGMPQPHSGPAPSDRSLAAFKEYMEKLQEAESKKRKVKKQANHQAAVIRRGEMSKQVLRAQRYLGLLQKNDEDALIPELDALSISALDPTKSAPYPFEDDAIFISIDVEAYEKPPRPVTEVGVTTLDTRDLRGVAPGPKGEAWRDCIRARHFRVTEYKDLINRDYVSGCPASFERQFGKSEFVPKNQLASKITSCFHPPFSKDEADGAESDEKRNIILLGHDVMQDVAYLQSIGLSITNRGNLRELLDTAAMFRSYTRDINPTSLGKILDHFDLTGWNLHNAGNDAAYTVWAMLAICVQAATERGSEEVDKRHADVLAERTENAVDAAQEKVKTDAEGWLDPGSGEDGGNAVVPGGEENLRLNRQNARRPAGPSRPPHSDTGLYTSGGVPLDV